MTVVWVVALGVVAGLAVLAVVVLGAAGLRNRQQTWRIKAYALRQGWTYRPTDPDLAVRWPDLPLMVTDGHARDVVTGQIGDRAFCTFVYSPGRAGHPGDALRHVSGAGVIVVAMSTVIPLVILEPVSFVEALGWEVDDQVQLGRPDFDAAWRVYGDAATARAILDEAVIAWLMEPEHRVSYGFDQGELVTWTVDRIAPEDLETDVGQLDELLGLIPPAVWTGSAHEVVPDTSIIQSDFRGPRKVPQRSEDTLWGFLELAQAPGVLVSQPPQRDADPEGDQAEEQDDRGGDAGVEPDRD